MILKILVLAVHFEVTGARYITDALKRLGHDVKHYGPEGRLKDAWGVGVPEKYIWMPDKVDYKQWRPDLIIVADTLVQTVQLFNPGSAYLGIPVIKWIQDNHVRNVREDGVAHYFLAHKHGESQPVEHDDETWLPCATDMTAFPPSLIPYDEREYDVCLVGVMYPRRAKLVKRLQDEGFKVFAATGLVYDEYRDAYHNSRMSLCVSANGDVAQRVFETLGMGCIVLTDPLDDLSDEETATELGLSGFSVYWSDDELVTRVREFLTTERELAKTVTQVTPQLIAAKHTWDKRAQVVVDWYERTYGKVADKLVTTITMDEFGKNLGNTQHIETDEGKVKRPYLNLGCGKTHLPSAKPAGHEGVDDAVYDYPLWLNVDKVEGVGADKTFDLFTYPWPLEDNSFDGALCAHILEHIPHEIKTHVGNIGVGRALSADPEKYDPNSISAQGRLTWIEMLASLQDGWYAFFSELYRVLTPGAIVHIVSPYGWSDGGITDPSHTRYLTLNTFTHSMTPDVSDGSTFQYNNGGINFVIEGSPMYRLTPMYAHICDQEELQNVMMTRLNVVYDFYVKLKAVK